MSVTHTHPYVVMENRQQLVGHLVQVHLMSPSHFRDMSDDQVVAVHDSQHEDRREAERRETVDHPDHYGGADDPYEVIKVLEAWGFDKDSYLFNVIKYSARAGKKDPAKEIEDLKKARWYLDRKIARLENP